jgi:archaemetzincin
MDFPCRARLDYKTCMTMQLALLPFEGTDSKETAWLSSRLAERGFACKVLPRAAIPFDAFDSRRGQFLADTLLETTRQAASGRVLGVVDVDLYTEGLNFVFGMADHPGRAAVIALTRLGLDAKESLYHERMLKEAVHELGHTFGLAHCRWPHCVMHFSNSLADTDQKSSDYCADCLAKLERPLGNKT